MKRAILFIGILCAFTSIFSQTVKEYNYCPGAVITSISEVYTGWDCLSTRNTYRWLYSEDGTTWNQFTSFAQAPCDYTFTCTPENIVGTRYYKLRCEPRGTILETGVVHKVTIYAPFTKPAAGSDQTICYNTAPLTISATPASGGNGIFTNQWQYSTDNNLWRDITGANQLSVSPSYLTSTTYYRLRARSGSGCGDLYSNTVTITVYGQLVSGSVTGHQSICYGSDGAPLNSNTAYGGDGAFSYQWQYSLDNSSWSNTGESRMNYSPRALTQTTYYRLLSTNQTCGSVNSASMVVHVYPELKGGTIGNPQTICYNTSPNNILGSEATGGYGSYTYEWYYSYDNNNFYAIPNTNSKDHQPVMLKASTYYKRKIIDNCGSAFSNTILITVNGELKGTSIAGDQSICAGGAVGTLTGENPTGGDGSYSYRWQKSTDNFNFGEIVSSNSRDLQPGNITETTYFRRITNTTSCGSATSNVVTVAIRASANSGTIGTDQTICYNTCPSSIFNASSPSGTYTTKWQSFSNSSWNDVPGATDLSLSPGELTSTTRFRRVITDVCSSVNSNEVTITVLPQVNPGTIASDQTICYRGTANSLVGGQPAGADGSFSYRWQSSLDRVNWNDLPGTNMLNFSPGVLDKTTSFRRMSVSSKCGETPSNVITITVQPELKNVNIAGDQTICSGAIINSITGETPSGGDGNYIYKWQKSQDNQSWSDIVNSNSKDYQPVGLTQTSYFRRITYTNNCGSATSNTVTINVRQGVTPGSIGSDQTICFNTKPLTITNSVAPTGTFTTKWYLFSNSSWTEIAGISDLSYAPAELSTTTKYRRTVTDACGSANSNEVTVTVLPQVNPGNIATDQTICYKALANSIVGAGATGAEGSFSYRWQSSLDKVNWNDISNSNATGYSPGTLDKSTSYRRVAISGKCGETPSNLVTITVQLELKNVNIAGDQTICSGAIVNSITGETPTGGDGNYTYKWQRSQDSQSWSDIVNSNSKDYQPVGPTQTTYFRRITYTNNCGSATSNTVTINVRQGVTPGTIGSDQTICFNTKPLTITNSVAPTGTFTTKWYLFSNSSWTEIAGISDLSYAPAELSTTAKYRRTVTDACGSANSNEVTVTVLPQVNPGTIATDQTICYKALANSIVGGGATGAEGSFSYRWQSSLDKVNWNDISNSNATGYSPGILDKSTSFRRIAISGKCRETPSNVITITVQPELKNINIAGDQTICSGAIIISITGETPTGGDGNYTYKWQRSQDSQSWSDIVNSNSKDYQPSNLTQTSYFRRITYTNNCGSATSNTVTINVRQGVTPGTIGSDQTICNNTKPATLTNTLSPTGNNTTKWYVFAINSWNEIPGITNLTYSPEELTVTTKYRRVVTDICGSVNSNEVTVTVLPQVNPGTISSDQTICYKASANSLVGTGPSGADGSFTYKWESSLDKVNWGEIGNNNSSGFNPGILDKTTYYRRTVTSAKCGETSSNMVTITVNPELKNVNIASDQSICPGGTISPLVGETPTGGDENYTYKWQKSQDVQSWSDIVNSNSKDYQPSNLSQTTFFKRVTQSANCGSATSNMVTINVTPELSSGTISAAQVICEGTRPVELTGTSAGGQTSFSYNWQSSSTGENYENILGANSQNYWPEVLTTSKYYRRQVSGQCAPKFSNAVFVSVLLKPDQPSVQVKSSYCKNEAITLSGNNTQLSYEWYDKDGNLLRIGNSYIVQKFESDLSLSVKAVNSQNCRSSAQALTLNLDKVKAGFTANTFLINKGEFVQFTSGATNANSHQWNFSEGEGSTKANPVKYFYSAGIKDVKLTVTSGNGCRDSLLMRSYITVSSPTGIEDLTKQGFSVYPSLAHERLNIETQKVSSFEIYIINWEGKVTITRKVVNLNKLTLNVENLPSGMYIVKIIKDREPLTFKFVKQ